ncbi:MAG: tetratricopeptide repeat protein [Syntrophales bacterium]|nr:tetratricopeptide repeat protein [Syntrophales bacterium]
MSQLKIGHSKPSPEVPGPIHPRGLTVRLYPFLVIVIIGLVLYGALKYVKSSRPFVMAEELIRGSSEVRSLIGEVKDCTPWLPVSVSETKKGIEVVMTVRVEGKMGSTIVKCRFLYAGKKWRLLSAEMQEPRGTFRPLKVVREIQSGGKEELLNEAHRFFRDGDLDGAIHRYSEIIALDPQFEVAYFWRAVAYVKKNRYDEAEGDFRAVVQLNPRNVNAYNWLGWLYAQRRNYSRCVEVLSKAVDLKKDNGWAYFTRSRCHYLSGEREKALRDSEEACTLGYKRACAMRDRLGR